MNWVTCADFLEPFIPGEWRPYRLARLSEVNPLEFHKARTNKAL
jgi:hypothetical protein